MTENTQSDHIARLAATGCTFVLGEVLKLNAEQVELLRARTDDGRVATAQAELLTAASRVISQRPGLPVGIAELVADLISKAPAGASVGLLDAAMALACGGPYDPVRVPEPEAAAKPIVDAVAQRLGDWSVDDPAMLKRVGAAIDRWRQATGIDGPNPTGVWVVRPDAVALGWRRPRLARPPSKPGESPPLPKVLELGVRLLSGLPPEQQVERLVSLVEQGMDLELAEEIAENGGLDLDA